LLTISGILIKFWELLQAVGIPGVSGEGSLKSLAVVEVLFKSADKGETC
jgi:hypothetical protein